MPGCEHSAEGYCSRACKNRATNSRRGSQPSGAANRAKYGYEKRTIIGIDGEGIHLPGEPPRYIMLTATGFPSLIDEKGLGSERIFKWLTGLPKSTLKFGFAFGYDINMILADVPRGCLRRLWDTGQAYWGRWYLRWLPGKQFIVADRGTKRAACVWDTWPFVQQSFVGWLRDWQLADQPTIDRITEMKGQRGNFSEVALADIEAYNREEVDLIAYGMGRMLDLIRDSGIRLRSYYGPGSIAGALMLGHGVPSFMGLPPDDLAPMIRQAYRGGRSETATVGWEHDVVMADLNSAYPDAERRLPCLAHASWHNRDGSPRTEWALCRVEWSLDEVPWGPFPVLPERGTLRYPREGSGWYWWHEVRAAQRFLPIRVIDHAEVRPGCSDRPFSFVEGLYERRRLLKESGDLREKIVKLGINSVYGKMAQQVGDKPPFQSFAWAGMVTAWTRARILDLMADDPSNVRLISTDGIVLRDQGSLRPGDGLGEWSVKPLDRILILQPGVYWADSGDQQLVRSRGFGRADIPFESVADWYTEGTVPGLGLLLSGRRIETSVTRFIGLGHMAVTRRWDQWRTWQTTTRRLDTNPWPRRVPNRVAPGRVETGAPQHARPDGIDGRELKRIAARLEASRYDGAEGAGDLG